MHKHLLAELLESRPVLLADGAMATNLFAVGLPLSAPPELWLMQHPDRVGALHQQFTDAGADIILTNSFGANARRLKRHDLAGRTRELNRIAALLAREVADLAWEKAGRRIVVAGCIGPTGERIGPDSDLTVADAVDVFAEQMEGLQAGGADVIWIETMSALAEIRAAAAAAAHVGMPYAVTASIDTTGRTLSGVTATGLAAFLDDLPTKPFAGGVNCSDGAAATLAAIRSMTAGRPGQIVIAKANAGLPTVQGDRLHYACTHEQMADYARRAMNAGARIIGGCCGTTPAHLATMRRVIDLC